MMYKLAPLRQEIGVWRELKVYSNQFSYPQLYVKGELFGKVNIIRDLRSQCAIEEHQGSLHLDDTLGPEIVENLTCMDEMTMWKSNFQLDDGGLFSYYSIGYSYN